MSNINEMNEDINKVIKQYNFIKIDKCKYKDPKTNEVWTLKFIVSHDKHYFLFEIPYYDKPSKYLDIKLDTYFSNMNKN